VVGQTVGKYRVVTRLGRGGMGTVYQAVDQTLSRDVAIKRLNSDLADPELLKRFRAEAIALARLNHPNIATLFELAEHEGELLMVMEFVRGETFDQVSTRVGPMPVERASQLCAQVLDALGCAHRAGIVHRDLKPANLMLTESGIAKVMDFGLARMIGTERLTLDGLMVGTPAYMAPEQALGGTVDGRSDVYAMGVVFYRLLTAELPFRADTGLAMVHKQINEPPRPVREVRPDLPPACAEVLARALAKAPDERYQTADEFKSALAQLGGFSTVESMPTIALPRPVRAAVPGSSRRLRLIVAAAAGAVLIAGVPTAGFLLWRSRAAKSFTVSAAPVTPFASNPGSAAAASPPAALASAAKKTDVKLETTTALAIAPAPRQAVYAILTFGNVKLLELDENRSHDRDASLRLTPEGLLLLDGEKTIVSVAYSDVRGLFLSHSREPRWIDETGRESAIGKTRGRFGFLKGTPDWVTVRTRRAALPLRVQDRDLPVVVAELQARTGVPLVQTRER